MKWYNKLLIGLLVIVFSPLIIAFVLIALVYVLLQTPKTRKEYKNSQYYKDFHSPYSMRRFYSTEYRFYNAAMRRGLPIQYERQSSNDFEYFVFDNTIFLFPDFEQINYDTEKAEWQVNYDGDWANFEESRQKLFSKLEKNAPKLPVKLLIQREMFLLANLNDVELPDCVYVTWKYETAFENEESPLKMIIPQSTKELYEMMLATPELCGAFEFAQNDTIHWDLYDNIRIDLSVDPQDCYLGVNKKAFGKLERSITHWHPDTGDIYNEVCAIGKRGNVLVIRSFLNSASVLYMGNENDCPYSRNSKRIFGKMYYLRAR